MTTADTDPFGFSDPSSPMSHGGTVQGKSEGSLELPKPLSLQTALQFLAFVHPHPQTYILEGPDRRKGRGIWHRGEVVSSVTSLAQKITTLQEQYRTIQFTPNCVQGGRSNANVTHLNCFYADVDKDVREQEFALTELSEKYNFHWHIKLETRPGKYQYFWLINPVEKTNSTLGKYLQVAEEIRTVLRNAETTTTDISHLMRVPGCVAYREDGNFSTTLIDLNRQIPRYSLEELAGKFPVRDLNLRYSLPREHSVTDNRNNSLRDYLAHICNPKLPTLEELEIAQRGFIEYAIPPEHRARDGFLEEIRDLPRRTFERLVVPSLQIEAHNNFDIKPDETLKETHPEEFYLSCPGAVGDVVRYLARHAPHIPAACHFAGTCGPLSALAGYSVRDKEGLTPTTYMGIVARSGTGKTVPLTVVRNAIKLGGFDNGFIFPSDNTTDVGMVKLLQRFGAVGCMYTDEANEFFNARSSKQTASYAMGVYTWLLKLHSAYSDLGVIRGPSLKELERNDGKEDALDSLDCPRLSWVFGIQPDFFVNHFLQDTYLVTQGFAGRIVALIANYKDSSEHYTKLSLSNSTAIWDMIKAYPCVEFAQKLHRSYYGVIEDDVEFTPVGDNTPTVIAVPDEHVHVNGQTNGHINGHINGAVPDELGLTVVPKHIEKKKRGRPSKPMYGLLKNKPEPVASRSSDIIEYNYSSVGATMLRDFREFCALRSSAMAASANIWTRGVDQAERYILTLRAFGAEEIEAITWSINLVKGAFLSTDTLYHTNNARRLDDKNTDLRKRVYEALVSLSKRGKETVPTSEVIDSISKKREVQSHLREIIRMEVEAGCIESVPVKPRGFRLKLVNVPPGYLNG